MAERLRSKDGHQETKDILGEEGEISHGGAQRWSAGPRDCQHRREEAGNRTSSRGNPCH